MADQHWGALRAFLAFHRFDDAKLEAQFQQKYQQSTVQGCRLWAAIQLVLFVLNSVGGGLFFSSPVLTPAFWALFSVPLICTGVVFTLSHSSLVSDNLKTVLVVCHCLTLATQGVQYTLFVNYHRTHNWELQPSERAATAMDLVDEMASYFFAYMCNSDQQLQLMPFLLVGFCPQSLLATVVGPLVALLFLTVGIPLRLNVLFMFPSLLFPLVVNVVFSCSISLRRRSIFLLELQRARESEEMQRADSMVNHIVKNVMVEAAGQIDAFLELCAPPPLADLGAYLRSALERLRSGMAWCRRRGVLLALMNKEARPNLAPTSLAALGSALASHRSIATRFADRVVELDEALTDLLLENAITNAFRHGHPTDPDVRFFITVDTADEMDPKRGACTVTFRITNRSHPNSQPLTPELVRRHRPSMQAPSPSLAFSEGIGLQHCFLAAKLQNMAISLAQEGDTVVFEASLVTKIVCEAEAAAARSGSLVVTEPLPWGLRISVIDDSSAARMLLKHQLSHDVPGCIVDAFGSSAEDVDPFLSHTLQSADIAILDQHLDWPSGSLHLGTDLVRLLLGAGFRGLICIRSANVSERDTQQYFAAGAHCVLDKLLDRDKMVAALTAQYWRSTSAAPPR
eukprot:GGOE01025989.1.p1 GENE.GGOE01025989.1~~GGOE01025989.1.p1  ORF type:complete len:640 (-),score=216.19 GGOE01025989.1:383-2263(-)